MSQKLIMLPIPDDLYERLQEAASASNRSVEDVALETIGISFQIDAELVPLETLNDYSTTQLWGIVQSRLPWSQSLRLRELSAKNKQQPLTQAEETELDRLVDLTDKYMLLRSQALLLLKQRGEDVSHYFVEQT